MKLLTAMLGILLVLLQYRFWLGEGGMRDVWRLEMELERRHVEISGLRERNKVLEAEVLDLKQGLDAIEERARSELGMIREGEIFYQVIQRGSSFSVAAGQQPQ